MLWSCYSDDLLWYNGSDLFFFKTVSVFHCNILGVSMLNVSHPFRLSATAISLWLFFYSEENMTISKCDDTKSQQATEHLMQNENILFFETESIFLSFSGLRVFSVYLGFLFLFFLFWWKSFWQKAGVMLEKQTWRRSFSHPVLSQQRMDHSLPFSQASSSLPRQPESEV